MQSSQNESPNSSQSPPASKHTGTSPFKGKTGIRRLINAFGYSIEGFKAAFVHEDAFRQEVFLAVVLIPLAIYLGNSPIEQALMIASVLLVLIVELLNSAIEAAVDHTSTEHHALAKQAKDIGSAAVFIALLILAAVWGLILLG
ncbi:MAG: diacylglycerol kinase [Methylotenera sp.]|nr:diacylglycerol kinase [Methylotenera sp.]MDO9232655.1 diacylglycerol kinase [Methylotenera sp.]MDO9388603.1 diacylglycerol kinase [Methylotenera sp.]MDP1597350.1 diacylglycerol kinase [Methylotenera sp.]MDP1755286.1 diacylglycerol kinase [Methylotenera sp.]